MCKPKKGFIEEYFLPIAYEKKNSYKHEKMIFLELFLILTFMLTLFHMKLQRFGFKCLNPTVTIYLEA